MIDETSVRKRLHDSIQGTNDQDDEVQGAVLIGFVVVGEWMDSEGGRWLTRMDGTNGGEAALTTWQSQGYLHNALNDWPTDYDQDEED